MSVELKRQHRLEHQQHQLAAVQKFSCLPLRTKPHHEISLETPLQQHAKIRFLQHLVLIGCGFLQQVVGWIVKQQLNLVRRHKTDLRVNLIFSVELLPTSVITQSHL